MRDDSHAGNRLDAEELEGFFSVNLDLLCIANLDGYFLKVNQAWCRILGHTTEELCQATILEAPDGRAAVELFRRTIPDLVLMDVQMPGMDGSEATRTIRALEHERGFRTSIVALTAGAFKEEQERCLSAGMDAFPTKPVGPDRLKDVIDGIRQIA